MLFKKNDTVAVIYPATSLNQGRILQGVVFKIEGSKEAPYIHVAPIHAPVAGHLTFKGTTGKGLGTEAFIVPRSFLEWVLK